LADQPERFDVIVMPNLYGDILSDVAAQITGSVGLAGSSNIGEECALFEAIHGSATDIAGQNKANPSGLLHAAIMLLNHIGQNEVAQKVHNAWLATIEEGIHTADIYKADSSKQLVGTSEFAEAVVKHLGQQPIHMAPVVYKDSKPVQLPRYTRKPSQKKELVGVDIFVHWPGSNANLLASQIQGIGNDSVGLSMITNRGIKVWPNGFEETFCTDHWRCRFKSNSQQSMNHQAIIGLLEKAVEEKLDVIKIENLYEFDGKPAFSMGQGQ
jgi:isocitrate dehydrogenase